LFNANSAMLQLCYGENMLNNTLHRKLGQLEGN